MNAEMARYLMPMCVFLLVIIIISLALFRTVIRKVKFRIIYPATYLIIAVAVYLITVATGKIPGQGFLWSFLYILGFPSTLAADHVIHTLNITKFAYFAAPVLGLIQYFIIGCLIDFIAFVTA